jgi:hypothetical protein
MKNHVALSALALALGAALPALAATDGVLNSASSTATFNITANGPVTGRAVQVLGASDLTISNSTPSTISPSNPGAATSFCVVDTHGGATNLTVSTGNPLSGNNWALRDGGGNVRNYELRITDLANTTTYITGGSDGSLSASGTLTAGVPAFTSASCGTGNLRAHVYLPQGAMPDTYPGRAYADIITMVASPL